MTINDAKLELFNFFSEKEIFDMDVNFPEIVLISMEQEVDKEIVSLALSDFEKQELVAKLPIVNRKVWVLTKPLKQYSQTIEIHYPTIDALVKIVNDFCEETNDEVNLVNPLQVTEKDIQNLIVLAHGLKNEQNDA